MNTARYTVAMAVALAGAIVGGCQKMATAGTDSTISRLRSGSEKVCTASDVQRTLRDFIVPSIAPDPADSGAVEQKTATHTVAVTYRNTTLESFDQAVSRATCNTTVTIGSGDETRDFVVAYSISPSAEDADRIVVTADTKDAAEFAAALVDNAVSKAVATREEQEQASAERAANAKLLAIVNPRWLTGVWITSVADASNCSDTRALRLAPNHVFSSQGFTGRWTLDGNQLHFIGGGGAGNVDDVGTITQADAISFTNTARDGSVTTWRRCARAEIEDIRSDPPIQPAVELPSEGR